MYLVDTTGDAFEELSVSATCYTDDPTKFGC